MSANLTNLKNASEEILAELTDAAYRVALRHGLRGSFLEAELELWGELAQVLRQRGCGAATASETERVVRLREPALVEVA